MSFTKDNQSIPRCSMYPWLPTWNVKNVHMKKRKCSSKYSPPKRSIWDRKFRLLCPFECVLTLVECNNNAKASSFKTPLKVFNIHGNFLKELGSFWSFKSIFFRSTGLYIYISSTRVHLAQGSLNIIYLGGDQALLNWIHSLMDFPLTVHRLGW